MDFAHILTFFILENKIFLRVPKQIIHFVSETPVLPVRMLAAVTFVTWTQITIYRDALKCQLSSDIIEVISNFSCQYHWDYLILNLQL